MITVSVVSDLTELKKLENRLSKKSIGLICDRAINRSVTTAKTTAKNLIKQSYNIKPSQLSEMPIVRANSSTLTGKLMASRKPIGLSSFNPVFYYTNGEKTYKITIKRSKKGVSKNTSSSKNNGHKGVTVEIKKGSRLNIPYAFITANDNEKTVFARGRYTGGGDKYMFVKRNKRINSSGSDTPITKILTTSIIGAINNKNISAQLSDKVSDVFDKRLTHEIDYELYKQGS